jgi:hypothetical protein
MLQACVTGAQISIEHGVQRHVACRLLPKAEDEANS